MTTVYCIYTSAEWICSQCFTLLIVKMLLAFSEMGTDLPGSVAMPGAVGAGQVRMVGTMPGRGGKRRSTGWVILLNSVLFSYLLILCSISQFKVQFGVCKWKKYSYNVRIIHFQLCGLVVWGGWGWWGETNLIYEKCKKYFVFKYPIITT